MSEPSYGTEFIGPFTSFRPVVCGYAVPWITIEKLANADDGNVNVVLDGRMAMLCTEEEAKRWLWFVANAMAVAAGYGAHGENSQPVNRYKCKVHRITGAETEETKP